MAPSFVSLAPCRLCLFGEHQDYLNLPVIALSLPLFCRIQVTLHPEADDEDEEDESCCCGCLTLNIPQKNQTIVYKLDDLPVLDPEKPDFALAALHHALKDGWELLLLHQHYSAITFVSTSDLPMQAGVSTSSAFCVAWIQALAKLAANVPELEPLELARRAHYAEVTAFGAPGGTMDHVTSALGGLIRIGPDPWQVERLIIDEDLLDDEERTDDSLGVWVLAYSGEPKDTLRHLWRCKGSRLDMFRKLGGDWDANTDDLELTDDEKVLLDATLVNRGTEVAAYNLWKSESVNGEQLGNLMKQHHEALRDGLCLSSKVLEAMNEAALQSGAWGFKVVGSGGGGCGVAWCGLNIAESVAQAMEDAGAVESWIIKKPSIGAHTVNLDSELDVFGGTSKSSAVICLVTYGKRFGSVDKTEYEQIWNCTKIPNPECNRKGTSGLSKRFRSEVMRDPLATSIVKQAIDKIVEDYALNDRDNEIHGLLKYGFSCEYGKHRSVSVAETVAEKLRLSRVPVTVEHRDVNRKLSKEDSSAGKASNCI